MRGFWNANTHYHGLILGSVPPGASRVLDVGCGDGMLCAALVDANVPHVIGLDTDQAVLGRAHARHEGRGIEWVHGDVHHASLAPDSFDAVVSVAALHHMDAGGSLTRFAQLVRPGGAVVIVGLAANAWSDIPLAAVAVAARHVLGLIYRRWRHSAPECWPPPLTYGEMKALSARVLPGVRYRRHVLGRYSLVWRKPQCNAVAA
ncbi:MAG TPA: class I SAM-dependent methyltransferase [Vicinamibacterales bacterium]